MLCIVVILIIIIILILWYKKAGKIENFLGDLPSFTFKTNRIKQGMDGVFYSTPGFQANLSPRMSGGLDIRSQINNAPFPPKNMMAVPDKPTGYANFDTNSNIDNETTNDDPNQPIIYDRLMYANRQSRLRSQGDPIRGDLPIIPINTGWFRPSVTPNVDLQEGAMNVLAGESNEVTRRMNQLLYSSLGNANNYNYREPQVNMANNFHTQFNTGKQDVLVTAYP